ncbi:hypothetical protein [Streptomyces sp. NPDC059916]|uniref:hypothetical protein n=1 Tax=Streptomyces sp. NPDC059916 TaxID=3347001 RepID=UPI00369A67FF
MSDQQREDLEWVLADLAAQRRPHDHLLIKDPYQLGWRCQVQGCRVLKPAQDFDDLRVGS